MTNWEKWKEILAAEDFASLLGAYCGEMPMGAACPYCPIKDFCNHTLYDDECKEAVLKWANAPGEGGEMIKRETKMEICFANLGHHVDKPLQHLLDDVNRITEKHYLSGMEWEEARPKLLTKDPFHSDWIIPELLPNWKNHGSNAYLTSLEAAFLNASGCVHHILQSVSDFDAATPEDFRREICKALRLIDGVEKDAETRWERMVEARAVYKMQHPDQEATK